MRLTNATPIQIDMYQDFVTVRGRLFNGVPEGHFDVRGVDLAHALQAADQVLLNTTSVR